MNYFLAKTDPDTYSIKDFEKEGTTVWDGVHNNAALLFIQKMRPGDMVYIYESMSSKAIVGLAEVLDEPHKNENDPRRSIIVTMKFIKHLPPVTLTEMKAEPLLKDFELIRQSRLSVLPVPEHVQKWIQKRLSKN